MAWRKKQSEGAGVEIVQTGRGVLLSGNSADVAAMVADFARIAPGGARSLSAADLGMGAGAAYGIYKTHQQYFQFSARALQLLKDHGALPAGDGQYNRSFVMDTAKKFAGNLDWKKVNIGPEQALSIQTATATLALRAAIKDVVAAIERVEGKVDELVKLVRAERLGSAIGDRRTLESALDLLDKTGTITTTDWTAIGPLGPDIARDIERLRAHITLKLTDVKSGALVRTRVDEAEELSEQLLRESMALLVVAEHNYGLWQQLRMAHVREHEPTHLTAIAASVQQSVENHYVADQLVLDKIAAAADLLTAPTGFEGFEPIQRRRLSKLGRELDETVRWFADQRNLDLGESSDVRYADFGESVTKTGKIAASAVQSASRAIGRGFDRACRDSPDEATSE
jgi:hypothetical protein